MIKEGWKGKNDCPALITHFSHTFYTSYRANQADPFHPSLVPPFKKDNKNKKINSDIDFMKLNKYNGGGVEPGKKVENMLYSHYYYLGVLL